MANITYIERLKNEIIKVTPIEQTTPAAGQLLWDEIQQTFRIYDGSSWNLCYPDAQPDLCIKSSCPPKNPTDGMYWHSTVTEQNFVWTDSQWSQSLPPAMGLANMSCLSSECEYNIVGSNTLSSQLDIGNGMVNISLSTGEVKFGENYIIDEAARIFWESVNSYARVGDSELHTIKKQRDEAVAELNRIRMYLAFECDHKIRGTVGDTVIALLNELRRNKESSTDTSIPLHSAYDRAMGVLKKWI